MILVWYRRDIRTLDHTALQAALKSGQPVVAGYLATPEQWRRHAMAPIQADLIARRLVELDRELSRLNVPLLYKEVTDYAECGEAILDWATSLQVSQVMVNADYEVNERQRDQQAQELLAAKGITLTCFEDKCIHAPASVLNKQGHYFKVFTPFKRAWLQHFQLPAIGKPHPQKALGEALQRHVDRYHPEVVFTYPRDDSSAWPVSTQEIVAKLRAFTRESSDQYQALRDMPAVDGTSRLSPYLAIGALSARQCVVRLYADNLHTDLTEGKSTWLSELIWREFYQHLLVFEPKLVKGKGFVPWEERIQWSYDDQQFERWTNGQTGYPIVDAAMRQLNQSGWMHNRLRMIVASFLTKDLHIDWRMGERYFMSKLIDGDFAANNGGWQWSASTGCDGQPYFRIFNPISQGEKFDPKGDFVRKWVPELSCVPDKYVHKPWLWPDFSLLDYHTPMVDHKTEREITLQLFKNAKD